MCNARPLHIVLVHQPKTHTFSWFSPHVSPQPPLSLSRNHPSKHRKFYAFLCCRRTFFFNFNLLPHSLGLLETTTTTTHNYKFINFSLGIVFCVPNDVWLNGHCFCILSLSLFLMIILSLICECVCVFMLMPWQQHKWPCFIFYVFYVF